MWRFTKQSLVDRRGLKGTIHQGENTATIAAVIEAWHVDAEFRQRWNAEIAEAPYVAFRWETPSVTTDTRWRSFEYVLIDSPELDVPPSPNAFASHFDRATSDVVNFSNIGGDSLLISPTRIAEPAAYGHLAAFARQAPEAQRNLLWKEVGHAMQKRLSGRPVWLSTAGAGVPWLHVRLDDRPKYCRYGDYRRPSA